MMIISKKEEESIAHLLSDAHLEPDVEIGIIKNVTSRLLVGLRWWNDIQEDGSNMWMFESHDPSRPVSPTDSHIFWVSLYAPIVIWIFFGFFALLKQCKCNIGYTQCDKDAKKKWASNLASMAASESPSLVGRLFTTGIGKYFG
nr:10151_t:CDS:2 [Entrophospora candida]